MSDIEKNDLEETKAGEAAPGAAPAETAGPDPEALRAELERAKAQAEEYLDGWKRAQAELVNYRKRVERDAGEARRSAAGRAAARWFPVLDDFERALKERTSSANLEQWAGGIELIYRKGMAALEAEGITAIEPAAGEPFDPIMHEAVTREVCADREDGEILEVVLRGYRMGDQLLRPAKVRVACKPEPQE
ncbi:MAG: nucleotide exchange factor GrpE [Anaerolineales bacterium]|nr:nucleotide exchange factor GrpE [Anaerolineales bacterium]